MSENHSEVEMFGEEDSNLQSHQSESTTSAALPLKLICSVPQIV